MDYLILTISIPNIKSHYIIPHQDSSRSLSSTSHFLLLPISPTQLNLYLDGNHMKEKKKKLRRQRDERLNKLKRQKKIIDPFTDS